MKYNARQNVKISQSSQIPNHSNFGRFTNQECSMPDYDVPRKNFYRQNIENNANGLNAKDEILIIILVDVHQFIINGLIH